MVCGNKKNWFQENYLKIIISSKWIMVELVSENLDWLLGKDMNHAFFCHPYWVKMIMSIYSIVLR